MAPPDHDDEENTHANEMTALEDETPQSLLSRFHTFSIKDVLLFASSIYILFTGFLYQANNGGLDFLFRPVATPAQTERAILLPHASSVFSPNVTDDEVRVTAANSTTSTTSITTSAGGPAPFCHMPFQLYRTNIHDMICNNENNTFGIIPKSKQENILFLHIPKTGGESLEEVLLVPKSHETWWQRRHWYEGNGTSKGIAITIIRNPFDRMYSWFKFCLHGYRTALPRPKQCVRAHNFIHSHEGLHNLTCVSLAFEEWIRNMFLDIKVITPRITLTTYDFIGGITPLHVDYIIRFEHYSEDYEMLAYALGRNETLVHKNGSSLNDDGRLDGNNKYNLTYDEQVGELLKAPYRDVYTDATKKMVESHFALDLITFNYTF
jgi:hypothetical protein